VLAAARAGTPAECGGGEGLPDTKYVTNPSQPGIVPSPRTTPAMTHVQACAGPTAMCVMGVLGVCWVLLEYHSNACWLHVAHWHCSASQAVASLAWAC
jgi:hypothetical protein